MIKEIGIISSPGIKGEAVDYLKSFIAGEGFTPISVIGVNANMEDPALAQVMKRKRINYGGLEHEWYVR